MPTNITFRSSLLGNLGDFCEECGLQLFANTSVLVELIALIARCKEEGVELQPKVYITNNIDLCNQMIGNAEKVKIGHDAYGKAGSSSTVLCGHDAVQLRHWQQAGRIDFNEIAARLRRHGAVKVNEFILRADIIDNGKPYELTLFNDGRAIVRGTAETGVARGVYSKYIGN